MKNVTTVQCPKCAEVFELSEALAHQVDETVQAQVNRELKNREKQIREAARKELESQLTATYQQNIQQLKVDLDTQKAALQKAQKSELDLRKERAALQQEKENFQLELQRALDGEREKVKNEALRQFQESHKLSDAAKQRQIEELHQRIEELQLKATQNSQQIQGEVLEVELERTLVEAFPRDNIIEVPKGQSGGDIIQVVRDDSGREAGRILWETKNTKNWSNQWCRKIKEDAIHSKADVVIILSRVLPEAMTHFGSEDGVWVSSFSCYLPLTCALREHLICVANTRRSNDGLSEKAELLMNYMRSPEFGRRVQAIITGVQEMKEQLDKERRAMERQWCEREKQILRITQHMSGMYGDLQGISGIQLAHVESLSLEFREQAHVKPAISQRLSN